MKDEQVKRESTEEEKESVCWALLELECARKNKR